VAIQGGAVAIADPKGPIDSTRPGLSESSQSRPCIGAWPGSVLYRGQCCAFAEPLLRQGAALCHIMAHQDSPQAWARPHRFVPFSFIEYDRA
jgi:hypothetical protein